MSDEEIELQTSCTVVVDQAEVTIYLNNYRHRFDGDHWQFFKTPSADGTSSVFLTLPPTVKDNGSITFDRSTSQITSLSSIFPDTALDVTAEQFPWSGEVQHKLEAKSLEGQTYKLTGVVGLYLRSDTKRDTERLLSRANTVIDDTILVFKPAGQSIILGGEGPAE